MGLKFCSDFYWVRDFETQGSRFYVKQLYQFYLLKKDGRNSGILLNYYYYYYFYFLIGLFLGYVLGRWTFIGPGSSLKDFFWV